jgi:hypothetical protein
MVLKTTCRQSPRPAEHHPQLYRETRAGCGPAPASLPAAGCRSGVSPFVDLAGGRAFDEVEALRADLDAYHLYHAVRGEMLVALGYREQGRAAAGRALALTHNPAEQALLHRRLLDWGDDAG